MRKNFGAKPWCYPQPVLMIASYDEDGNPDIMNAAWGGISGDAEISVCLSEGHKTVKNILKKKAFTISIADKDHVTECDYVGIVSANDVPDKFVKAGFHAVKSEFVDAPVVEELFLCLECKMKDYDRKTGILTREIINVSADERILTDGKIDPEKLCPITFDPVNHRYLTLGKNIGNAFSAGLALK